jgi:hypothetical protein
MNSETFIVVTRSGTSRPLAAVIYLMNNAVVEADRKQQLVTGRAGLRQQRCSVKVRFSYARQNKLET